MMSSSVLGRPIVGDQLTLTGDLSYHFPNHNSFLPSTLFLGFPGGSVVNNLPAKQENQYTWVAALDQEDSLEKEMATHSSILA